MINQEQINSSLTTLKANHPRINFKVQGNHCNVIARYTAPGLDSPVELSENFKISSAFKNQDFYGYCNIRAIKITTEIKKHIKDRFKFQYLYCRIQNEFPKHSLNLRFINMDRTCRLVVQVNDLDKKKFYIDFQADHALNIDVDEAFLYVDKGISNILTQEELH